MFYRTVFSVLVLCTVAAPSFCENSIFLRFNPGVPSNNDNDGHAYKDWIDVVSINNIGKPGEEGPIIIEKKTDGMTVNLQKACVAGTTYTEATIEVCKKDAAKGPVCYYIIKLTGVTIDQTKQNFSKTEGDGIATEELTCSYKKINWEYRGIRPNGSTYAPIQSDWDNAAKK
jgi:type VI secretion system Hcp family effector